MSRLLRWTSVLLALAAVRPAGASAQSLLGAGGLGAPVHALDARARALGNVGIGLFESGVIPTDPALAADIAVPSVTFTTQTSWIDLTDADFSADGTVSQFPLFSVAYPVLDHGMAIATLSTFTDQRFEVRRERVIDLDVETARVTDIFTSDGGVSVFQVGFARRILPSLAVGATVGTYVGSVTRRFVRVFDSVSVETDVPDFQIGGLWNYSGPVATLGASWDLEDALRVAGSVTVSGSLDADADEGTVGAGGEFDVPVQYRLGASGLLAPGLTAQVGLNWADWTGTTDDLAGEEGRSALDFGAGVELDQASVFGRRVPLRLGYRRTEFPFTFDGEDATESAFTGGFGWNLVQSNEVVLARVDLALERGAREAGTLEESFWRTVITARVAGF